MEGYQDSDILLFFGIVAVIIIYFFMKNNKKSSPPPAERNAYMREQPAYPPESSRGIPANPPLQAPVESPAASRMLMDEVKGVFVVVTSSDPQTQLMAMSLSTQILGKGKSVRILLCGPGGDLAVTNSREVILKPLNVSPQMLLKKLIQSGVNVEVCPFYMANKDVPATLIGGVATANPSLVADGLLEPGVKLFTF